MKKLLPVVVAILISNSLFGQLPLGGLLAWYPFCGNTNDQSPTGLYSLTNFAASLTTDRFTNPNDAYSFNGATSSLSYAVPFFNAAGFASSDFTFSCWVYPLAAQSSIIWYNGNPATSGFGVYMNNGTLGTPGNSVEIVFGGGIGQSLSTPIALNTWHHLLLTKNGGGYLFYIDNSPTPLTYLPGTPYVTPTTGQFTIGQDYTSGLSAFNGSIDDFAIYNVLTTGVNLTQLNTFDPDVPPFTLDNVVSGDTSICSKTITLIPSITYNSTYEYSWTTGDLTPSVTVTPATTGTTYGVTISEPYGCTASAFLTVKHINVTVNIGPRYDTFCTSGTAILNPSPVAGEAYLWSTGDTTGSITVTGSGTYWVVVDSAGGCVGTDSTTIIVEPPVFVNLGNDTSSCDGSSITAQSLYTYSPGATYQWGGIPLPAGVTTNPTYTVTSSGEFWLTVTIGACKGSDTANINVVYDTLNIVTQDTAICKGGSVQVRGSGNPFATNLWTPTTGLASALSANPLITPDTSAWYKIVATLFSCKVTDSFYIDVQPRPVVYIGGNRNVCTGDTIHITAIVTPAWYTHYIYNWSPGTNIDNPVTTTSDSIIETVVFTAGDSTDLILTVTTPLDSTNRPCRAVDSAEIMVHTPQHTWITDTSLCPNDSLFLNPNAIPGDTYAWHSGIYLSDSNVVHPLDKPITTTFYWIQSTDQFGCHDTMTQNIAVLPGAVIDLGDSVTLYPGQTYQISPQTNCVSFIWSPPIGLNDTLIANPIASPPVNTKYIVKAKTEWGCYITDSINIDVNPSSLIDLPNAFTPGASANGILYVLKRGSAQLNYFHIFNRWGNLVYNSNNIDAGWDGTYKGTPQPFDVYVYDLEAVTNEGIIFHKTGNVTLLR